MQTAKMKIVYVITKRNNRHYWNRVGVAFVNHDGSINAKLEAVPVTGELHIRDYVPRDEPAETFRSGAGAVPAQQLVASAG